MEPRVKQALGIIETRGYTPLVTAVDGAIKAAQVSLLTRRLVGGGLANATVTGDVGAVKAAMDAAAAIITNMGAQGMTHVIARPAADVWKMLEEDGLKGLSRSGDDSGAPLPPGGGSSGPEQVPAMRNAADVPAVRQTPEVPAIREETEVPAVRAEAGLPVVQENLEAMLPEVEEPESELEKAARAVKKAPAKKKPRKTSGKK
ncbi:hypothetical protein C4J81_16715 [Deltaproteobacteria bacterium Smac51]|nr:hypothetical protein C4J81_16715 [Deltaproteobacteria bacterium Smac51]